MRARMLLRHVRAGVLCLFCVLYVSVVSWAFGIHDAEGTVADAKGPVEKASVGWQGQTDRVTTDAEGRFRLPGAGKRIIASKTGYRIASEIAADKPLTLRLERLPTDDNADYDWIDPH